MSKKAGQLHWQGWATIGAKRALLDFVSGAAAEVGGKTWALPAAWNPEDQDHQSLNDLHPNAR